MHKSLYIFLLLIFTSPVYAFDIYNSVSWKNAIDKDGNTINNYNSTKKLINSHGLKHIRIYYHKSFLTDGKPDHHKIQRIALLSRQNPEFPISFDIEIGNNNKPETVLPTVIEVLDLYHYYGGKAPVGVYALLPQNTYGGINATKNPEKYVNLNKKYELIASKVDFLSPVFYNYDTEYNLWKSSVDLGMKEAKKYASKYNLKILPYFSISYFTRERSGKVIYITPLGQEETTKRLSYLKSKGASGVIIWDSSNYNQKDGSKPIANINQGWLKGTINFIKK